MVKLASKKLQPKKTIKAGKLVAGRLSAGRLSAGKLTAGGLQAKHLMNATRKLMHPKVFEQLSGAGFFDKLSNVLNVANTMAGTVKKAVDVGKNIYDAGKSVYGAYKQIRGGKIPVLRRKSEYNKMMANEELSEEEGGVLSAGKLVGGKDKPKRKLPEVLRKRAEAIGKYMRQGKTMKQASDLYHKNGY